MKLRLWEEVSVSVCVLTIFLLVMYVIGMHANGGAQVVTTMGVLGRATKKHMPIRKVCLIVNSMISSWTKTHVR